MKIIPVPTSGWILSVYFYYNHLSLQEPVITLTALRDQIIETGPFVISIRPALVTSAFADHNNRKHNEQLFQTSRCLSLSLSLLVYSHPLTFSITATISVLIIFWSTLNLLTSKYSNGTAKTPVHEAVMNTISIPENRSNSSRTYTWLRGSSNSRSSIESQGESNELDLRNADSSFRGEGAGDITTWMSVIEERTDDWPPSEERRGSVDIDCDGRECQESFFCADRLFVVAWRLAVRARAPFVLKFLGFSFEQN